MTTRKEVMERIQDLGLVVVVRLRDPSRMDEVVEALGSGGASIIEITVTVPGAIQLISKYVEEYEEEYVFGCGTVTDQHTARRAMEAGAAFVVSPILEEGVIAATSSGNVASVPAALTPTEAFRAWRLGADAVKLFPAGILGPRYLSDLLAPLPELRIMPAGGIGVENAASFIEAGAVAVFSGSSVVNEGLARAGNLEEIEERAREMICVVSEAKGRRK